MERSIFWGRDPFLKMSEFSPTNVCYPLVKTTIHHHTLPHCKFLPFCINLHYWYSEAIIRLIKFCLTLIFLGLNNFARINYWVAIDWGSETGFTQQNRKDNFQVQPWLDLSVPTWPVQNLSGFYLSCNTCIDLAWLSIPDLYIFTWPFLTWPVLTWPVLI